MKFFVQLLLGNVGRTPLAFAKLEETGGRGAVWTYLIDMPNDLPFSSGHDNQKESLPLVPR